VMVKVSVEVPFNGMFAGEKPLLMVGGATTVMVAVLLVLPVPPLVEVMAPVVLFLTPAVVPVTFTEIEHELLPDTPPPERLTEVALANAVKVPPQVLLAPGVDDTFKPAGKLSLNAMLLRDTAFRLVIEKLNNTPPLSGTVDAPNNLLIVGGATTVRDAVAVFPVPPSVEETVTLLFFWPAVDPVTFSEIVHDLFVASVAPDKLTEDEPAVAVVVPPQFVVSPFGVATTRPAGKVSVKPIPVSEMFPAGLPMVKLSEVDPFSGMLDASNDLVMVGGDATLRFAEAVLPVPPLVEVTVLVVLVYWPDVIPVTFTITVQLELMATLPPERLMLVPPAVAEAVPAQLLVNPFGVVTTSPVGNVSVKATPASATELAAGLVIVKVKDVVPFRAMAVAPNALAIDGGATTATLAEAVLPVPPLVEVTAPVTLLLAPAVVPVTFTLMVHEAPVTVPPLRLMVPVPAVAVTVPQQLLTNPLGGAITRPAGIVSLKPTPVSAEALEFERGTGTPRVRSMELAP